MRQQPEKGQEQLLKEFTALLQKNAIPYMITGSVSVIFYGRPRASHDIDFVVEVSQENLDHVKDTFLSLPHDEFLVDILQIENALNGLNQFNVLHLPTMLKLDFWLLTDESFDKERFKRRMKLKVFKQPMTFSTAEDTILKKLLWYKESKIEKHFIDAAFIYQIQLEKLDNQYLKLWAEKHKTIKLLEELAAVDLEQYY